MMKKALIQGTRICEFGTPFPVHSDLKWVDVPDDTTTKDTFVDGQIVKHTVEYPISRDISDEAERRIAVGLILSNGVRFRCDNKSIIRITVIKDRPSDRFPQSFKTSAGVDITIPTIDDAVMIFNQVADYVAAVMVASATIQDTLPDDFTDNKHWPSDEVSS